MFTCDYPHRHPAKAKYIVKMIESTPRKFVCGQHLTVAVVFISGLRSGVPQKAEVEVLPE